MADSNEDRRQQHYELLRKSKDALEAEQNGSVEPAPPPEPEPRRRNDPAPESASAATEEEDDGPVVMYRGRAMPTNRKLSTPGGGGNNAGTARQFRGAGSKKGRTAPKGGGSPDNGDAVKQAIRKLTEMREEGLITQQEYDLKRKQLLDRL